MDSERSREKAAAAQAAVERVRPGMRVALGTGSTAELAVHALARRFPRPAELSAVASSRATEKLARDLGISVRPLEPNDRFDLMIDGADEVTPRLELTKGGGGALFREKFLARLSETVLIVVDPSKLVPHLGMRAPIPVEVVPFARPIVSAELERRGFDVRVRKTGTSEEPFATDNGNEILDLQPKRPVERPAELDRELLGVPGVLETGIFIGLATRVIVGEPDGTVRELAPGPALPP